VGCQAGSLNYINIKATHFTEYMRVDSRSYPTTVNQQPTTLLEESFEGTPPKLQSLVFSL